MQQGKTQQDRANALNDLRFPILSFSQGTVFPFSNSEELTECNASALRAGFYENQRIIDSNGRVAFVKQVKIVSQVGGIRGFSFLGGRRVRVALDLDVSPASLTLGEVRKEIAQSLQDSDTWSDLLTNVEFMARFNDAATIRDVILIIYEEYNREYKI